MSELNGERVKNHEFRGSFFFRLLPEVTKQITR